MPAEATPLVPRSRPAGAGCLLLVLAALATPALRAQSNDEIQSALQWNLSTPGARSLALGGAFLALADDATAAYANPAGLAQLARPEISVEGRVWDFTSRFVDRGHQPATGVTGIGVDVVDGLQLGERRDRSAAVSFASYVHGGGRVAWAVYRHQLADFEASLLSHGPFAGQRESPGRAVPASARLRLDIESWGAAAAYRPHAELSLGLALAWQRFRLRSHTDRFDRRDRTGDPFVDGLTGGFFGPADFLPDNVLNVQTLAGSDEDLGGSLGVLWRPLSAWSVGAVYRRGGDFGFRAQFVHGPASAQPGAVEPTVGGEGVFHAPDSVGAGVAWRPRDDLVIAFDWQRVGYSALADDLVNVLLAARGEESDFSIADADELHLGAEYQAVSWRLPMAFRLGVWHDPDHRLRYGGRNPVLRARFAPGDDQLHLCGGLGMVLGRAQVDLAVDSSELVDTVSLSTVARF
jgi:long-subunit fatty acid transport protein